MENCFYDILVRTDGEYPIFCYRSGLTVYEEGFVYGNLHSLGWNGAGFTLNVLEDMPTYLNPKDFFKAQSVSFDADGVTLRNDFTYNGYELISGENCLTAKVKLNNSTLPITVYVYTTVDGTAIISRKIEIENNSNKDIKLGNLTIMAGGLDKIERWREFVNEDDQFKTYSVGYFDDVHHCNEGAFNWHDISPARTTISGRYSYNRFRHPMFMLKNNVLGSIWFAQLGYSGGYAFDIDFDCMGDNCGQRDLKTAFTCRLEGENPIYIIKSDKKFTSPEIHIGMMNGDLCDIVNEMHAHTRKTVFTHPFARGINGGIIEGGIGPERTLDLDAIKHFADTMAYVGAEALIVDAGWYCPPGKCCTEWWPRVGDWEYDKDLWQDGIDVVRDYIHNKGLLFGMWMEVERAGNMSKVFNEHPDWFITTLDGVKTTILDATKKEVIEHLEKAISHLVDDYKIDILRLDYNIDFKEMHYKDSLGEDGEYRYYENLYAMFDRLRQKYPDVLFENCASGGARTDLGLVKHFTHTWVTDHQLIPTGIRITNGMTMVLPPEYVDRLASGMFAHIRGGLDAMVRHTLFGRPTTNSYNCIGSKFNPKQLDFVKHCYDIYKNVIRPFAPNGKIYHHTPVVPYTQAKGTVVLERSAVDNLAGVIGVFTLAGNNSVTTTVYPKGVDADKVYDVTLDNSGATVKLTGYEMINNGIKVNITQNLSSELIIYKQAK